MDNMKKNSTARGSAYGTTRAFADDSGFSLIEVLIAVVILSIALLSLSSVSLHIIGGNKNSSNYAAASLMAQEALENLRNVEFNLGGDMAIGGGDDSIAPELTNCSLANDATTDPATIFSNPDYAYTVTSGVEDVTSLMTCPSNLVPDVTLRRTWVVSDNTPAIGMKSVTVVVGWAEKGVNKYFDLTTAYMGE